MPFLIEAIVAVTLLAAIVLALILGKRHARRLQRARHIHVDRFKLKRRHAAIELEVFGSREVVDAIRGYAKEHHATIEEATRQARTYLREIVPKFNPLAADRTIEEVHDGPRQRRAHPVGGEEVELGDDLSHGRPGPA